MYITSRTEGAPGAPLVFTFHGTGGDQNQFHALGSELVTGAAVVSPRGDVQEGPMNRYFRRTAEGVYDMDDLAHRAEAMADFVADEVARHSRKPVIGLGYSNGANILASMAFQRPTLFDALVLWHPLIPWTPAAQPGLSGKRVLVTAGRRDPICPAPATRKLADYFKAQGSDLRLVWHDGGHELRQNELDETRAFLNPELV